MLTSKQLRANARCSLQGKYWKAFAATLIVSIIASLSTIVTVVVYIATMPQLLTMTDVEEITRVINEASPQIALGQFAGLAVSIFICSPINIGCCKYFIENREAKPSLSAIFSGYKKGYGRNIKTMLVASVKVALWMLLLVVPAIIKIYEYAIIPYILADDPEISSKEAFKKARQMMKGNKWRLFKLSFSFIGWEILGGLAFGIGTYFVVPYIEAAYAEFYAELKNN